MIKIPFLHNHCKKIKKTSSSRFLFTLGSILAVFGILIFIHPRLLQILVALLFITLGFLFLFLAWEMRKMEKDVNSFFDRFCQK